MPLPPRRRLPSVTRAVNLQEVRLSAAYRSRLGKAGSVLAGWARERQVCLEVAALDPEVMTELLISFLQDLFQLGAAHWLGLHAVLAVQTRWRHLKGKLRGAWDSVGSWDLLRPIHSRTPLPLVVLRALHRFGVLAAVALEPSLAPRWWAFAVVVQVAFFGLLRPSELWRLSRANTRVPSGRSLLAEPLAVLTIVEPKNRRFGGRLQVRAVRDRTAVAWISWMARDLLPADLLWPFGAGSFKTCLDQALNFLGLGHLAFTPACFRAGGATHLFETGTSISNIRFAGSWSSERVLSHYLQQAEAAAAVIDIPEKGAQYLEGFLAALEFAASPPALTWSELARRWTPSAPRR